MIVICSGPDTFRARERMRGLVEAFRTKHDAEGFSMETIDGRQGLSPLLARLSSASLFTRKKLVRADGCLTKMKIADVRILAAKLKTDGDATILCTLEDDSPDAKALVALKEAPCHLYPFPVMSGREFRLWVRKRAEAEGVTRDVADAIATSAAGDSWIAVNEIAKASAYPTFVAVNAPTSYSSSFDVVDAYLRESPSWRSTFADALTDASIPLVVSQSRSQARVADSATEGMNPYVIRKMQGIRCLNPAMKLERALQTLVLGRSGYLSGEEWQNTL
ncbi:MAG: hypothetical protein ABIK13_02945 [Patescibacteria group bacterium]